MTSGSATVMFSVGSMAIGTGSVVSGTWDYLDEMAGEQDEKIQRWDDLLD